MKHELVKSSQAKKGKRGFFAHCNCGWVSAERFMPELATAEFEDHVTSKMPKKKSGAVVYDI